MVIFVKEELVNLICTVKQSSVKTGIANALGTINNLRSKQNVGTFVSNKSSLAFYDGLMVSCYRLFVISCLCVKSCYVTS